MELTIKQSKKQFWEYLIQGVLLALVFIFYSFEKENIHVSESEVFFFLNYTLAAYFISYVLLPRFLYKKKYILFFIFFLLVIGFVIYIEEQIIEKIYFPDTRGKCFPGVFNNLAETIPIITIITGFKFTWDALSKQSEVEQLKNAIQESELMYLKSQINPHFLFNNLNNLYAYSLENSPNTPEIILELSSVLRYILYEARGDFVPVSKEIDHLNNYIKLSKLHLEERGKVNFAQNVANTGFQIAPLILPVFVENAFKHCQSSQTDNIFIAIDLNLSSEGKLTFTCTNSFSGQSNIENLSKGIGLENVQRRLEILYPKSYSLFTTIHDDIFKVRLELQLKLL
jgi:Ca2+/Na+ antiporter